MEIASICFLAIAYLVSAICCRVGNDFLFLSVDSDYDPSVSFTLFNAAVYSMSLSVFTSSAYAFLLRPVLENRQLHTPFHFGLVRVVKVLVYVVLGQLLLVVAPFYLLSGPAPAKFYFDEIVRSSVFLVECLYFIITFLLYSSLYYIFAYRIPMSPFIRMYFDHTFVWGFCSVILNDVAVPIVSLYFDGLIHLLYLLVPLSLWITYVTLKEQLRTWGGSPCLVWIYQRRKLLEFAIGMVGSILFQYFFRSTSTSQMEAFLFFAAAWLGNLAMVQPSTDVGIFNFLLVNACLSWAVNLFKIRTPYTWLVFVACFMLYYLRWKLYSVTLRYDRIFEPTRPSQAIQLPQTVLPSNHPLPPTISVTTSPLQILAQSSTISPQVHQNLQINGVAGEDGVIPSEEAGSKTEQTHKI